MKEKILEIITKCMVSTKLPKGEFYPKHLIAEKLAELFDAEIEKRMPTEEKIINASEASFAPPEVNKNVMWKRVGFIRGARWACSIIKGENNADKEGK